MSILGKIHHHVMFNYLIVYVHVIVYPWKPCQIITLVVITYHVINNDLMNIRICTHTCTLYMYTCTCVSVTVSSSIISMTCHRTLSFTQVVPYMIAQFLGAFFSAAVVYGLYVGVWCVYVLLLYMYMALCWCVVCVHVCTAVVYVYMHGSILVCGVCMYCCYTLCVYMYNVYGL